MFINSKTIKFILFFILILSVFFRFWQIESFPPGLYPDEAMNANDALESLQNNDFKLFYPYNNGREGLFMWFISASFYFFGVSLWSLKLPSAIIGTLTVLGIYLLAKELFIKKKDSTMIALLSSFFLAVSFWHTNFSRISFRAIIVPFSLVFSFYFLLKSFREKKIKDSIFSGIFFGIGFYSYPGFRLAVILLFLIFFFFWRKHKKENSEQSFFKLSIVNLLSIFLTALPIGIYFLKNPQDFLGRNSQVSIFSQSNILGEFFQSLILHLGMFNFWGDGNWRHNLPRSPQLLWIVGIFFLIGLFLIIKKIIKNIQLKKILIPEYILMAWFMVMLLPGVLTSEGCPHALRVIGTIPVVYILSGLGAVFLYRKLYSKVNNKNVLKVCSLIVLLSITISQYDKYFVKWSLSPETEIGFSSYYVDIGNYLNSLPNSIEKIVIVNFSNTPKPWPKDLPVSAQTTMFIENTENKQSLYLLPENINKIIIKKETVIIPINKIDEEIFQNLKNMFPNGEIINQNNILIFKI